jgi:hypothetical protein
MECFLTQDIFVRYSNFSIVFIFCVAMADCSNQATFQFSSRYYLTSVGKRGQFTKGGIDIGVQESSW